VSTSPFHATHTVPDSGLDARSQADPNQPPVARLDPWLEVEVLRTWGAWAEISCSNGWTAWVDARALVARPSPPPPPPVETPTVEAPPMIGNVAPAGVGSPPAWTYEQAEAPQPPTADPPVVAPTTQVPTVALPATPAFTQPTTPAYTAPPPVPAPTQPSVPAYAVPTSASGYTQPPAPAQHPSAYQQAGTPAARKLPVPALVGGAIAGLAGFAPWLTPGGSTSNGFDVPAKFLIDYKTSGGGGLKLGLVVLAVAIAGGVLAAIPGMGVLRRVCGWACVLAGALYVVQLQRLLSAFSGSPSLFDTVGIGALIAVAGGLVLALSPDAS